MSLTLLLALTVVRSALGSPGAAPPAAPQEPLAQLGGHLASISDLDTPRGLAFDEAGRLHVVESGAGRVRVYDSQAREVARYGAFGTAPGELRWPEGIALGPDGEIFVADGGNDRVVVFDRQGRALRQFGSRGAALGQMRSPQGIACDGERVAVADSGNNRVQLFDHGGRPLAAYDHGGALERPVGIAFDAAGRLWIGDADRARILVLEHDLTPRAEWGDQGSFPGLFSEPAGIATARGLGFVADSENHRVQVFDDRGGLQQRFGLHAILPREGQGKLHYPRHLAVSADGARIALSEPLDDRVQLLGPEDDAIREAKALRAGAGQASPHFGMRLAAAGELLAIVEPETHSVLVHQLGAGEPVRITRYGGYGDRLGLLRRPEGLWIDERTRRMWVCDAGNARLQEARIAELPPSGLGWYPALVSAVRMLDFTRLAEHPAFSDLSWVAEPLAVEQDDSGRVFVLDGRNALVHVLSHDLLPLGRLGAATAEDPGLDLPTDIALVGEQARLMVVDAGRRCVLAYDTLGGDDGGLPSRAPVRIADELWDAGQAGHPWGIAALPEGRIALTDLGGHRVVVLDAEGALATAWGGEGLGATQLYKPRGLAVDGAGRLIVLDHANHRGMVFDERGGFLDAFGSRSYVRPARAGRAEPDAPLGPIERPVPPWPPDEGRGAHSLDGRYWVSCLLPAGPLPLNEEFAFELRALDGHSRSLPVTDAQPDVDARMPAHGHGLLQAPKLESLGPGRWRVSGLLLHMIGHWELHVDLVRGAWTERASFDLELE